MTSSTGVMVQLTKGQWAIVDPEDAPLVLQHKWCATPRGHTFYAVRTTDDGPVLMHRLLAGAAGGQVVDHRDGNGLNNRRSNLRLCTKSQNQWNRRKRTSASSRFKGVHFDKQRRAWYASIHHNQQDLWLGAYRDEEEAARAYDAKARELFGDFAHTNFNDGLPATQKTRFVARPRKLNPELCRQIIERFNAGGITKAALAKEYGVAAPTVSNLVNHGCLNPGRKRQGQWLTVREYNKPAAVAGAVNAEATV